MDKANCKKSEQIKTWFSKERHRLLGKGVWLQGGEPNCLDPDLFYIAKLKVLFVRLSAYSDVSAGITHSYLYQMGASVEGCYIDMAFLPPAQDEQLMRKEAVSLLLGTSSKEPALNFDVIAISNSVLQELINLPAMLEFSAIPLSREAREREKAPIVLLGGSNSCTHSILHGEIGNDSESGLVDGVLMGDGEQVFVKSLEIIRDNNNLPRAAILKLLRDKITGFYEPSSYHQHFEKGRLSKITYDEGSPFPVRTSKTACEDDSESFTGGPILYEGSGASHVIVSAGCPSFCSFCKESWEQKPYRENSFKRVIESASKLKVNMGLNEIALMTFNANTCSEVFNIVNELENRFDRVSIKSQRFDAIVNAPSLLDLQFEAGKRTYTCAMEGISERLRALLQKNLDEHTILRGIDLLMERNMRQMKVFLILTGYENDSDVAEFKAFLDKIGNRTQTGRNRPKITFSFAVLFRAPQTPMEFAPKRMNSVEMKGCLKKLCALIKAAGYEARISSGTEDALFSEHIAYGDRRYTKILVEASVKEEARYRGEIDPKLLDFWEKSLKKYDLPAVSDMERDIDCVLPWEDIDTGINKAFLWQTWKNVSQGKELKACIAKPWGSGVCGACGACKTLEYRNKLNRMGSEISSRQPLSNKKINRFYTWIAFEIPEKWGFCSREFIKSALARRLMLDSKEMAESFLNVEKIEPEIIGFGKAFAKIATKTSPKIMSVEEVSSNKDIFNIRILNLGKLESDIAYPSVLEVSGIDNISAYAREIDGILGKYALKHQKQRTNTWLNWQINSGQAKKVGIVKISLNENDGVMEMTLSKAPESFLLNKIADNKPFKIVSLGNCKF